MIACRCVCSFACLCDFVCICLKVQTQTLRHGKSDSDRRWTDATAVFLLALRYRHRIYNKHKAINPCRAHKPHLYDAQRLRQIVKSHFHGGLGLVHHVFCRCKKVRSAPVPVDSHSFVGVAEKTAAMTPCKRGVQTQW